MKDTSAARCDAAPDIVMTASFWRELSTHLLRPLKNNEFSSDEQLAFILASSNNGAQRLRLLAREMLKAGPEDLVEQGPAAIKPRPEFVMHALNRCRNESLHLIEVHSHPFSYGEGTTFSGIDWRNDEGKMPGLANLLPEMMHVTMVMGRDSLDAHYYDRATKSILPVEQVVVVGAEADKHTPVLRYIPTVSATNAAYMTNTTGTKHEQNSNPEWWEKPVADARGVRGAKDEQSNGRYQRQEMVFGQETQRRLAQSRVAIVGLGGLGSFVALELAHLGVGQLILIDPDEVEESNLNRLLGAEPTDAGESKVAVYERLIRRIAPSTRVKALPVPIMDAGALNLVKGADILVGCVDSHGARMTLNQIAIRYLIPLVDGGSGFKKAKSEGSLSPGGQVQAVVPGIGCLECRGFIDTRRAAFDLAPPQLQAEERAHGYGTTGTAPAVIFLNGVIASLQVAEVLFLLAGTHVDIPLPVPPLGLYNAYGRTMTPVALHASPTCPTCGDEGVLAVGDLAPPRPATALAPAAANEVGATIPLNASIASEISATQQSEDRKETASELVEDLSGTDSGPLTDLSEAQETSSELLTDVSETLEAKNGLLTDVSGIQVTDNGLLKDLSGSSAAVVENVPGTQETDDGLLTDVPEMEKSDTVQPALVVSNDSRGGRFRNWLKKVFRRFAP
jgi:ThiF family